MREFFELFDNLKSKEDGYRLEIGWTEVCDWCISLRKGTVNNSKQIFSIDAVDRNLMFSQAYVRLSEYMSEIYGGY